jgi:serine/threonine-protein kinase RsbW
MCRFRLIIDSNLSDVFLVSVLIRAACDSLGLNAADTSSVDLCAVEAVTNVIRHAYLGAHGNDVSLEVQSSPQRLDLYVRDRGHPMPQVYVARLQNGSDVLQFDPADLSAVPEGGMGLQIVHQLMDETAYSVDAGTNCLRLTKFLKNANL